MNAHDIHLCLVGKQPLPNLIPALDEATRPRQVILLVSDDMRQSARLLRSNLEKLGCGVDEVPIHPYRIEEIRATVLELLARHERQDIALNATGATKIMSLGACDVFREFGRPAFYVDTDNSQFIHLFPAPSAITLPDLVKVKTYLAAYGYDIESKGTCMVVPARQQFGDYLVGNVERLAGALGILNACAKKAEKQLWSTLLPHQTNHPPLQELLRQCGAAGLLSLDGTRLIFADEDSRYFVNGGWLEEYVLKVVNCLKGQQVVRDHLCNVVITSSGRVKNEIDLAFTARNRLHLIECKTARLSDKKGKEGRADDVAYKLETLRDLVGGAFGKAMLVSYQTLTPEDRQRCREYRIKVVEAGAIKNLPGTLKSWIASK